jgi:hypothetical protein
MRLSAVLRPSATGEEGLIGEADRRRSDRKSLTLSATAKAPSAGEVPIVIRDISPRGLLIEAESATLSAGDLIRIGLPDKGLVVAQVVWASGVYFGCQLDQTISPAAVSAALLKSDPHEPVCAGPSLVQSQRARIAGRAARPELNLSLPFGLSVILWGLIAAAVYQQL